MKRSLIAKATVVALMLCVAVGVGVAETRTWTSRSGNTVQAEFLGIKDGEIALKLQNGNTIEVALNELSAEDNAYVRERLKVQSVPNHIYVDPDKGSDAHSGGGTESRPMKSISAAIALIPKDFHKSVTIHLQPGEYSTTGGHGMPKDRLWLRRPSDPQHYIHLVGEGPKDGHDKLVVLNWLNWPMVTVLEGRWRFTNVQVGTRSERQRQAFRSEGSASQLELCDVRIRTAAMGPGVLAQRAGRVHLMGKIEMNEDLHDKCDDEKTLCGLTATDHGTVKFVQGKGASLSIGNGYISASYHGCVRLGCETAKITRWTKGQCVAGGGNGRLELAGTKTHLRAMHPFCHGIGLEGHGYVLAEGTPVVIESNFDRPAIYLMKSSTVFGGPFEIRGNFPFAVMTKSGSTFAGIVKGDVRSVHADTGSHISLTTDSTAPTGEVAARRGGVVSLPDGRVVRESP